MEWDHIYERMDLRLLLFAMYVKCLFEFHQSEVFNRNDKGDENLTLQLAARPCGTWRMCFAGAHGTRRCTRRYTARTPQKEQIEPKGEYTIGSKPRRYNIKIIKLDEVRHIQSSLVL